jgi:ribonuclease-3
MDEQILHEIEQIIGYTFTDRDILIKSFCHSSSVDHRLLSNERLEFIGDSILALIICQHLFERFTSYLEGDLTKMKSMLVSRKICSKVAKNLGLNKYLCVGKGMTSSRALAGSLAAGLIEAIIAAIYFDGGMESARGFVLGNFKPFIDKAEKESEHDNFKSLLQQYAQQHFNSTPIYALLDEKGPDHDKCFESQVKIDDRHFPSAWGTNKKEAEQKAAFNALVDLGVLDSEISESSGQEISSSAD